MPPQNAVELVATKSGDETPKNGNLNNNTGVALTKFDLQRVDENIVEPTRATIVIPPDGGFGWVVMVSRKLRKLLNNSQIFLFNSLQVSAAMWSSMVLCSVRECSSIQSRMILGRVKLLWPWLARC